VIALASPTTRVRTPRVKIAHHEQLHAIRNPSLDFLLSQFCLFSWTCEFIAVLSHLIVDNHLDSCEHTSGGKKKMQTVELKSVPDLKRVIVAAFPTYKKTKALVSVFGDHGVQINSYWDGGSRSTFAIVELATMRPKHLPTRSHPYFEVAAQGLANQSNELIEVDHVGNVTLKVLPEGYALIEAGTFCGKPATAHVFLNPANMPKLIAA
jgi:hypothetical protein